MSHSPISILSQIDFNGRPLPEELLMRTFRQLMDAPFKSTEMVDNA